MTSPEAIVEVELRLGIRLPEDYRAWLLDPEAPNPVPSEINIPDDNPWVDEVSVIYRAERVLADTLREQELVEAGFQDFPSRMIPIGENDLGDYYLLSIRAKDFGGVYFYFHETANLELDDDSGMYALAESFAAWLSTLSRKEADPDTPDWERIRSEERQKILSSPSKRWWQIWR